MENIVINREEAQRVCNKRTYYLFSLIGRYISVEIGSKVTKPLSASGDDAEDAEDGTVE